MRGFGLVACHSTMPNEMGNLLAMLLLFRLHRAREVCLK